MVSALTLPAGRRAKFVVALLWLAALVVVALLFAGKFQKVQKNDPASFLPGHAESLRALRASQAFPSGDVTPAVVVFRRDGGLTAADRARVASDRAAINAHLPPHTRPLRPPILSPDGTTALLVAGITAAGNSDNLSTAVSAIRARVDGAAGGGLVVRVTGPAGFSTDAIKVFKSINGTLVLATLALVFVLLVLIYRSPIFWIVPLFSVGAAELLSRGIGYGIAKAGVTVNGQSSGILTVLVFGAGTDYALLLVARYREELRRNEDKHAAMAMALRRAGPAIVASALTVIAALLCMLAAQLNSTAGLGPIGAIGVGLAMVVMLTLLPALLLIAGRRAFWPFVPHAGDEGADETHGPWRRVGLRVARRPRPVWIGCAAVLAVLSVGLVDLDSNLTSGNGFRGTVESVAGQRLLSRAFPAGTNAPATVVVGDPSRTAAVRSSLASVPGVAALGPVERGAPGAQFDATLVPDPYSEPAFDLIPRLRRVAKRAGGPSTLIGGPTAQERDTRLSAARDNLVIVPLVLLVVLVILAALLRALVAPLLLIATVIVSFLAALGVGSFAFRHLFGFAGAFPALPLFAFIFLVALGVDYNIFLMARVREESLVRGTREGMLRGLAVTGGVITSAGIVLAGTFATLAVLPLVTLTEIGSVIAFGVLLDTFIVRSLLVPALVFDLGGRVWWPSRLERGGAPRGAPVPSSAAGDGAVGAGIEARTGRATAAAEASGEGAR